MIKYRENPTPGARHLTRLLIVAQIIPINRCRVIPRVRVEGAVKLLRGAGAEVVAAAFVIDLPELGGAAKLRALDVQVRSLIAFEGH